MTTSATSPHNHVARAQLLDISVVRPGNGNHLETKYINISTEWREVGVRFRFFTKKNPAVENYLREKEIKFKYF